MARRRFSETKKGTMNQWIDISVILYNGMVHWPKDPPIQIEKRLDMERGSSTNVSAISMGLHSGTHIGAPLHFIRDGKGIDEMPLESTLGRARVIEIYDQESIKPEELLQHQISHGERVLFKTLNSDRCWNSSTFVEDFVYISQEAARELVKIGVQTVGVDYLSVGGYRHDGVETHRILLSAGIWVIEGLNLSIVKPGIYSLICLPLRVLQGDGAPARAILKPSQRRLKR